MNKAIKHSDKDAEKPDASDCFNKQCPHEKNGGASINPAPRTNNC